MCGFNMSGKMTMDMDLTLSSGILIPRGAVVRVIEVSGNDAVIIYNGKRHNVFADTVVSSFLRMM